MSLLPSSPITTHHSLIITHHSLIITYHHRHRHRPCHNGSNVIITVVCSLNVDMFSIGVVAYTLLCGYEPFFGNDDQVRVRVWLYRGLSVCMSVLLYHCCVR